jgi:hypothetical protein
VLHVGEDELGCSIQVEVANTVSRVPRSRATAFQVPLAISNPDEDLG